MWILRILTKKWDKEQDERRKLRLLNVNVSADIIKFGAYLTGHDEETKIA